MSLKKIKELEPIVESLACFTLELTIYYIFYTLCVAYVRITMEFGILSFICWLFKIDLPSMYNTSEYFILKRTENNRRSTNQ